VVAVKKKKKKRPAQAQEPVESSSKQPEQQSVTGEEASTSANAGVERPSSDSPRLQEARQWDKDYGAENETNSPFAIGDEEEFQNVWGGGEGTNR